MRIFHWIWFLLTGFVVGLISRAVWPGSDKMGDGHDRGGYPRLVAWRIPRRSDFKTKSRSEISSRRFFHVHSGAAVLLVILRFV